MSKKVKGEDSDTPVQVAQKEVYLLNYKVSESQEKIISAFNYEEDANFMIDEFSKSQNLREQYGIENCENLVIIAVPMDSNFGIELPSVEIRANEFEKLFQELSNSISDMEESND